ncbi:hypothetical protein EVAR_74467_1 [Eumeta japonica]|uniref:Uncharacterized protein n=1 Tax=Eumeta variegata TaxID=151549 RepID=A0A4C1TBH7_EUMVA|nr:hypothetical protein EVAR_74467_1 [Eumeta japonica]
MSRVFRLVNDVVFGFIKFGGCFYFCQIHGQPFLNQLVRAVFLRLVYVSQRAPPQLHILYGDIKYEAAASYSIYPYSTRWTPFDGCGISLTYAEYSKSGALRRRVPDQTRFGGGSHTNFFLNPSVSVLHCVYNIALPHYLPAIQPFPDHRAQ